MARNNKLKKGALDLSSIFPVDGTENAKLVHLTNETDGSVKVDNSALDTKVSDLETADSTEQARAEAAELVLTTGLAAEAVTARAAEGANATAIAQEASRAAAAEAVIQADVDQNELDADAAIAAEAVTARAAELANATAISDEETRALAAEAAIQADVDQNELDSDAAELALSNRLDTLEADPTTKLYVDGQITAALASEMTFRGSINASSEVTIASPDNGDVWVVTTGGAAGAHQLGGLDLEAGDMVVVQTKDNAGSPLVDGNGDPEPQYHLIQKNLTDFISKTDSDAADATLQSNLDAVEAAALSARNTIQADIDQNELDGDGDRAAIRSEFASVDAAIRIEFADADAIIQADVDSNETARDAADALLSADTQSVFSQLELAVAALIRGDHFHSGRVVQSAIAGFVLADGQNFVMDLGQSFQNNMFMLHIDGQQMDPKLSGAGEWDLGSYDAGSSVFTSSSGAGGQYIQLTWQPQIDSVISFNGVKQSSGISVSHSASYSGGGGATPDFTANGGSQEFYAISLFANNGGTTSQSPTDSFATLYDVTDEASLVSTLDGMSMSTSLALVPAGATSSNIMVNVGMVSGGFVLEDGKIVLENTWYEVGTVNSTVTEWDLYYYVWA